jgi:hypothetical protein
VVIAGFDRAFLRAPPPTLPVAPVMMSFIFFDVCGEWCGSDDALMELHVGRWVLRVRYKAGRLVCCEALEWLLTLLLIRNTYRLYHQAMIDSGMTIVTILTFFVCDGGGRRKQTGGGETIRFAFAFRRPFLVSGPLNSLAHPVCYRSSTFGYS